MNCLEEYLTSIKPRIDGAVDAAMPKLANGVVDVIGQKAQANVYIYPATGWAMSKRRGTIGKMENMEINAGGYQAEIVNHATMQGGMGHEVEMVEEGWSNFRQPGPRPFMDEALDEYVSSGRGDRELAEQLRAAGFEVV